MIQSNCFIIAEIGVNHNGDIDLAKKMIDSAKKCGADAVKFQTYSAEALVAKGTPKVAYQLTNLYPDETHFQMLKKLELSKKDHFTLKSYCDNQQVEFLSTPYDLKSAVFLDKDLDVRLFKTASADIVDIPLHNYIASTKKPALVSVGMASMSEIKEVVDIYDKSNLTLLHCVSNYPCTDNSLNMNVLRSLKFEFGTNIGFSDHSWGYEASVLSIAFGSQVIEKHFTLDKKLDGPDHKASSSPQEFSDLVKAIRRSEKMMGTDKKQVQPEEEEMRKISRKSITLVRSLVAGDVIKDSDITLKRPGTGLMPNQINKLIGRSVKRNLDKDYQIQYQDLE